MINGMINVEPIAGTVLGLFFGLGIATFIVLLFIMKSLDRIADALEAKIGR